MSRKQHPFTLVELLVILAIAAILFGMIYPCCGNSGSREKARRISCTSNLKQVGLAFAQYAGDFDGNVPPENGAAGLEYLRRTEILADRAVYVCPSDIRSAPKTGDPLTEPHCSYLFYGGGKIGSEPFYEFFALATDKPGNHDRYWNTLWADCHVTGERSKQ